jgi:1-acyl-sn-glycerol-3-phosphate acyltransferase
MGIMAAELAVFLENAETTAVRDTVAFWAMGFALGALLVSLQPHPRRGAGFVPLAECGCLAALAWAWAGADLPGPGFTLGIMGGIICMPLRTAYRVDMPDENLGVGLAIMNTAVSAAVFGCVIAVRNTAHAWHFVALAFSLVVAIAASSRAFMRELIEQVSEILLAIGYRVRAGGPGLSQIPLRGPVLIIGNHAAWFDPLWVGKIVPRPIYPMMTSRFFDKPVLRWLMSRVVQAIRVPEVNFRRDAPELKDAIGVLDRGECLMIFPEGAMRRKEEQPLRQFGQGVWRILQQRPQTPVIACWIEGSWGCYFSYYNGLPTMNKRLDFRRPIDIAFGPLQRMPADLLNDQRAIRSLLMEACSDARRYLGLPPLTLPHSRVEEGQRTAGQI